MVRHEVETGDGPGVSCVQGRRYSGTRVPGYPDPAGPAGCVAGWAVILMCCSYDMQYIREN